MHTYTAVVEHREPSEAISTLLETSAIRYIRYEFVFFFFFSFFYYLFIASSVASREPRRNLERSSPSPRDPFSFAPLRSLAPRSESISDLNAEGKGSRGSVFSRQIFSRSLRDCPLSPSFFFLHFCYRIHATVGVVASVCIYVYVKKNESASVLQNAGRETLTLMYVQSPRKVLSEGGI